MILLEPSDNASKGSRLVKLSKLNISIYPAIACLRRHQSGKIHGEVRVEFMLDINYIQVNKRTQRFIHRLKYKRMTIIKILIALNRILLTNENQNGTFCEYKALARLIRCF